MNYINIPTDPHSISDNFVTAIEEDKDGNIWICTEDGLNKYEYRTNRFVRYFSENDQKLVFTTVIVDDRGEVWAGTNNQGIFRIKLLSDQPQDISVVNYRYNSSDNYSISSDLIRQIYQDSKDRIWIGTDNGLNLLTDYKKGFFRKIENVFSETRSNRSQIWKIYEDKSEQIFIGSTQGFYSLYQDINGDVNLKNVFSARTLNATVISICQDKNNNLWLGTYSGGLFLWDGKSLSPTKIVDKTNIDIKTKTIHDVFIDRTNVVWVGTKTGLLKWSQNNNFFNSYYLDPSLDQSNLDNNLVLALYKSKDDKLWVGDEKGLYFYTNSNNNSFRIDLKSILESSHQDLGMKSIYQDKTGTMWVGSLWKGLYQMDLDNSGGGYNFKQFWYNDNKNPGVNDNSVFKIVEDKWDYLWMATNDGVKRFSSKKQKFYDVALQPNAKFNPPKFLVYEIYKSPSNNDMFWIGTRSEGLFQFKLGENENEIYGVEHFVNDPDASNSISSMFVRTILEDKKGRIWVGTIGGGLNLLNPDSSSFKHYGVNNGLPSEVITGLLSDDYGYIWGSSFAGLFRFDPDLKESINFSKTNGLRNIEFNGGSYYKDKNDKLYFGGTNGFDVVYPERIHKNELPPPVVLTDIQLFNKSILNRIVNSSAVDNISAGYNYGTIELLYNENVISFEFSALDFVDPENNQYAYMLDGIDTSWNYIKNRRYASYSLIPPGEYTFKVKASNNNNVWNKKGAWVKIIIVPPYWQTWWFKVIVILFSLLIIWMLYSYRIRQIKEKKHLLEVQVKQKIEDAQKLNAALNQVEALKTQLEAENVYLKDEIKLKYNFSNIATVSNSFIKILKNIENVAKTESTVLILGETGTGKELIARAIHEISYRKSRPLIKVDCTSLPASLIESELFGHEKGAFTGAISKKIGRFEFADQGTIFLDEIGEISLEIQSKLLRVIQEGEINRVGNSKPNKIDVRIIAATNRNLEKEVKLGNFREDLFYRLNVFPILIPPLRDRKEDIPLLTQHFVKKYSQKSGKNIDKIPQSVINSLRNYNWPGNVRELENIIERAVILSKGSKLEVRDVFKNFENSEPSSQFETRTKTLEEVERDYILKVLKSVDWHVYGENGAAKLLGMKPTTLSSRMKKLQIYKPS